jgi:parvulin-like peptidyl-prolyl isomerase
MKSGLLLRLLMIGALLALAPAVFAAQPNGILAVVDNSVITFDEVQKKTETTAETLYRQYRDQPSVLEKKIGDVRKENLESRVSQLLILHDFKTAYNVPESLLDKEVDREIQERIRNVFGDRMRLTKTLQEEGITMEKFRQQIRDQFIIGGLRQKNVSSEIIISPHKIETYYLAHKDDYKIEDQIKLRMIVLVTNAPIAKSLGGEIISKVKEGATFEEMAKIYSEDKTHPAGEWPWMDRSVLRKELSDVAFSLKVGQVSDVIQPGPQEAYILTVEDKHPAHVKALSEVRDVIESNLKSEEQNRLEKLWIDRLKKKTFVRYF